MFKSARWRSEKNKIKAVFKLQFQATQVPQLGWETMAVVLVPLDIGKPTVRSEKAAAIDGSCCWANPVYETVKFSRDAKTAKISDKTYQFLISATGSSKGGILGDASVNLADYADVFKPSSITLPLKGNTGAFLHVTIQRMVGDDDGRDASDNGEMTVKPRRRTLQSQLSKCDDEQAEKARTGKSNIEDNSNLTKHAPTKFLSSRNLPLTLNTESNGNNSLQKSHSFDAISASDSDNNSSERFNYTAKESVLMHNSSFVSPLSNIDTPKKPLTSSGDWSASTDGSTSNSGEATGLQDSEESVDKLRSDVVALTRKYELSELELQTLRKQIVKESRRGQDLLKEINKITEERDELKRECQELRSMQKGSDGNGSSKPGGNGEDPWVLLEEIKKEFNHERSTNSNLRLQLQKTQESNSELLLAVKELEEMVEEKNGEISCLKTETGNSFAETETISEQDELYGNGTKGNYALGKKVMELNSEVELYRKDREDLEMQMEQLALDYEILKQENHDISSKLEQTQLREQLRMQYECSAHLAIITDLESHVESLEREIKEQNEAFEAELASLTDAKVEQEKRAVKAEEELRKARWSNKETAERIQDEFKTLSTQVNSMFDANERLLLQARKEASELRVQKRKLEELVEKNQEEIGSVRSKYQVKVQQLLSLVDFKSKEIYGLVAELKNKNQEFQNQKKGDEEKLRALSEEMFRVRNEMERVVKEREEELSVNKEKEKILQDKGTELEILEKELVKLREEVSISMEEIKNEKERTVTMLRSEIENLKTQCSDLERELLENKAQKDKLTALNENGNMNNHNGDIAHSCRTNGNSKEISMRKIEAGPDDKLKLNKLLKEMEIMKERNELMEEELKEMQERYSEISLKFAEVEGERQQLVMTVRTLKNALRN